jgi:hypothetical protein
MITFGVSPQIGQQVADAEVMEGDGSHPADADGAERHDKPQRPVHALHACIVSLP